MKFQEIVLGQTDQRFTFDPPDGRPDAAPLPTVNVLENGLLVEAATGACEIDPVSTVLHGDACRGSTQLSVADATGIVGRGRYLMTKPEGEREWIEVTAVNGTTLSLAHPLIHRYAGAATIVGCRISIAVSPDWVIHARNLSDSPRRGGLAGYMLCWSYWFGGHEVSGVSFVDLVTTRADKLVTPHDIDERFPGWIDETRARRDHGADFIAEAFDAIRLEAIGDGHAQRRIKDSAVLRELVGARAQVIRLEQDVIYGQPRAAELAIAEERYHKRYAQLVKQTRPPRAVAAAPPRKSSAAAFAKGSEPGIRRRIPKLTNH
jgi:hypothetical protein